MDEKKTHYRQYTEEFKIERDLGITPGLLMKWRDRYQVIAKEAEQAHLELSDIEAAKREIKRLKRRLA